MVKGHNGHTLIYESVLEHLKRGLLEGEWRPGSRLPTIAALARQLKVSPPSVREAYRILQTMGILEVTQGRGTFVRADLAASGGVLQQLQLSGADSVVGMLETWRLLKPEVAALAAERATEAEANAILETATAMESLTGPGPRFAELDYRFDALIFASCHNATLSRILNSLIDEIADCTRRTTQIPGHIQKACRFHKLIAVAIKERNPDAARAYMLQHVKDVESDYLGLAQATQMHKE